MIVISLFIALMLERLRVTPAEWQVDGTAKRFDQWLSDHRTFGAARQHETFGPFLLLLPALLLAILLLLGTGGITTFLVNLLVLTLVIGCRPKREAIREWFLAVQRDDHETQREQEEILLDDGTGKQASLADHLVWLNFRFYFAVAFWFLLFGAPGALAYGFLRANSERIAPVMDWVDWLPARVAGFAYLMVGNFSKGMPVWLAHLPKFERVRDTLLEIAHAAEEVVPDEDNIAAEPEAMLALARRSTILLLAAIALATLFGWVV